MRSRLPSSSRARWILSLRMWSRPAWGGGQLAELLKDSRPDMKILSVSGYTETVVQNHQINEARTNFLQKAFTLAGLGGEVREVLENRQAAAASASR